jgi:hypothetical protein
MVSAAFLSRKTRWAGPSGAANPAVRRLPTGMIGPAIMPPPCDGDFTLPYPYFTTPGGFTPASNGGALCAF